MGRLYRNACVGSMSRLQGQTHQGQSPVGMDKTRLPRWLCQVPGTPRKPLLVCPFLIHGLKIDSKNLHNSPEMYSTRPGRRGTEKQVDMCSGSSYIIFYYFIYSFILSIKKCANIYYIFIMKATFIEHLLTAWHHYCFQVLFHLIHTTILWGKYQFKMKNKAQRG